jgi:anti-sigma regulatory factor (Ser/Thr protein kinase)
LLELESPASLTAASEWRAELAALWSRQRLDTEKLDDFKLALTEIVANVIQHAEPPARTLRLRLGLDGERLSMEIEDDGAPFADFETWFERARTNAETGCYPAAESGRGLFLLLNLFSCCEYLPKGANRSFNSFRVSLANAAILVLAFVVPPLGGLEPGRPAKAGTTNIPRARSRPK